MNRMLFIHPAVKRGVSLAARAASWLLLLIALGNCLFLLFSGGAHPAPAAVGVLCVAFGELLLPLLLAALLLWCHCVLAAESGLFITRVLAAVAVVLGAAHAAHRILRLCFVRPASLHLFGLIIPRRPAARNPSPQTSPQTQHFLHGYPPHDGQGARGVV